MNLNLELKPLLNNMSNKNNHQGRHITHAKNFSETYFCLATALKGSHSVNWYKKIVICYMYIAEQWYPVLRQYLNFISVLGLASIASSIALHSASVLGPYMSHSPLSFTVLPSTVFVSTGFVSCCLITAWHLCTYRCSPTQDPFVKP